MRFPSPDEPEGALSKDRDTRSKPNTFDSIDERIGLNQSRFIFDVSGLSGWVDVRMHYPRNMGEGALDGQRTTASAAKADNL
jgi:hypothetical protein